MSRDVVPDLIVDIGMSEGNDTEFYLKKGFRVVGVEADTRLHAHLAERFATEIDEGRLRILHRAAWSNSNEEVTFFANARHQGGSHVITPEAQQKGDGATITVRTIGWTDIVAEMGLPYYCKIDIENAEAMFLKSFIGSGAIPSYASVEVHTFAPIEALYQAGYRRFKLVNQTLHQSFRQPNPPLEGVFVPNHKFVHASGMFGRELPGNRWLDFRETALAFEMVHKLKGLGTAVLGWFDCHAALPE